MLRGAYLDFPATLLYNKSKYQNFELRHSEVSGLNEQERQKDQTDASPEREQNGDGSYNYKFSWDPGGKRHDFSIHCDPKRGDYSFQKDGKSYHFSTGGRSSGRPGGQNRPQQYQPPHESRTPVRRPEWELAKKENGSPMKTVKKSIIPLACVAAMWLGHALNGGLASVGGIIRCAVLSAIAFAVLRIFFPDKLVDAEKKAPPEPKKAAARPKPEKQPAPEPQPAPAAEKPAAYTELEEVLKQGHESIAEIRRLNDEIPDFKISAQLKQLEILTEKIFAFVEQHPEDVRQIRQFLNFYLPTTIKLLQQYVVLQNQEMRMGNIDEGMQKIENMLDNVIVAFQKQLDSLFESDVVDITADIQVMEQMMAAEGLTGEKIPVER